MMGDPRSNRPQVIRLPLDQERNEHEMPGLSGKYLTVFDSSSVQAAASVRFNDVAGGQPFPLRRHVTFEEYPVFRAYISNAAQPGEWLDVLAFGDPRDADGSLSVDVPGIANEVEIINASGSPVPVDLKANSVGTFNVDLVGQTVGNLNVNLAAQDLPIEVEQRTFAAGSRGTPAGNVGKNSSGSWISTYTVPASKTFTIARAVLCSTTNDGALMKIERGAGNTIEQVACGNEGNEVVAWRGMVLQAGDEVFIKSVGASGDVSGGVYGWLNNA